MNIDDFNLVRLKFDEMDEKRKDYIGNSEKFYDILTVLVKYPEMLHIPERGFILSRMNHYEDIILPFLMINNDLLSKSNDLEVTLTNNYIALTDEHDTLSRKLLFLSDIEEKIDLLIDIYEDFNQLLYTKYGDIFKILPKVFENVNNTYLE